VSGLPDPQTHCLLCGMRLYDDRSRFAEGDFCPDSAGCRRRALSQMQELRAKTDQELQRRLLELAPQVEKAWVELARLTQELAGLALTTEGPH